MIRLISVLLVGTIVSMYFFPFEFVFLPGVNTKMAMAGIGLVVLVVELAGKKDTYNGLVEIIPTSVFADLEITSGTAPAPEDMNALPVKADMNKYVKFKDVTFASTTFSSNKVTGKINAGNITFYDQFATNATFNTSKKYDVIGAVSIYNSTLQVNFISAEEVEEPTLNVEITNADFGKIAINGKAERTLTLNGSLLMKLVLLIVNH